MSQPLPLPLANAFRLDREIALITGGGTGLGLGIAKRFAEAGATVFITGRRPEPLQAAIADIGPNAHALPHDVTNLPSAPDLMEQIKAKAGNYPTILINNAGNHFKKPATDVSDADFQAILDTHVKGSFALTRAAAPHMIAANHGNILFMASMASLFGIPQVIAYTAAKAAFTGMTKALATEFSPHNVRVNAIAPGWIKSDISDKALNNDPARKAKILGRTPMNRLGAPDDIALAALYLCSPAANFVTGTTLVVDGGVSIGF